MLEDVVSQRKPDESGPFVVIQTGSTSFVAAPERDIDYGEVICTNRTWDFGLACEVAKALESAVLYKGINFIKGPLTLRI